VTNTLAYYDLELVTTVKSFIAQAPREEELVLQNFFTMIQTFRYYNIIVRFVACLHCIY